MAMMDGRFRARFGIEVLTHSLLSRAVAIAYSVKRQAQKKGK